jgi:AcrR family transcriptional regulator
MSAEPASLAAAEDDDAPNRTQEAILSAYTELIEELGTDDVSFRLIARRAGIGERTIFRNYATRVDLLLATASWIERSIFTRPDSSSVFDIPLAIREAMVAYDRRPELAHVVAETAMRGVSGAAPSPTRDAVAAMLAREVPSLPEAERLSIVAALSHLDSAATWVTLRRELHMDGRDIADAAGWAAEAVLDPIRARVA